MKKSKIERCERAAERVKADVAKYKQNLAKAKARQASAAADSTEEAAAAATALVYEKKLRRSRETLANTLANLTPGSPEVKQYVREQQLSS